jgi:hypothetical protein
LRFDCFCFFSDARVTASDSAVCEKAAVDVINSDDINANEKADAPKTRARECLARKAILPQPVVLSFGSGWRAPQKAAACWLPIFATGTHPCPHRMHLVTPGCGTGQQPRSPLYIDCKLQQLDCGRAGLYKHALG